MRNMNRDKHIDDTYGDQGGLCYTILLFTVRFVSDAQLPKYKGFALRGGIGNMLLDEFCMREQLRKKEACFRCEFLKECIVQRIMYAPMEIPAVSMSEGSSEGYVVECEDRRELVREGDTMVFRLLLFGKTMYYLSPLLSAVYRLGIAGLGGDQAQFETISIQNERGDYILNGQDIFKDRYRICRLERTIDRRLQKMIPKDTLELKFLSPIALKKKGTILENPTIEELLKAAERRIYIMNCFEGIPMEEPKGIEERLGGLKTLACEYHPTVIPRYSFRKDTKIYLKGSYGTLVVSMKDCEDGDREWILRTLLAGEVLHVGSNTSFGFGRYRVNAGER